jgi:tetratricopeptide (TPR) repeat protein
MTIRARTIGAAFAALAACAALPLGLEAQEAGEIAAAAGSEPPASPLSNLRRGRDAFMGARDFSAALTPAQNVVDAQREQRESAYAADLAALGLIQAELRRIDDAIGNLVDAIGLVEGAEGAYSVTLVEYYRALGRTYIKSRQYEQAIVSLEQAQHISQRNLGLFNVEQSPLLDDITTAYLGLGDTAEAQKLQLERLDNAIRRFGEADPRVIPYRYTLAKYYQQSRLPDSARAQYEEVVKVQSSRAGETDESLLAPLRELVALDLLVSQGTDPAQRDRLASLLEQNASASPTERGLSLALLGDWAIVAGDAAGARGYYREAWSSLQSDADNDVDTYFGKPMMVDFIPPISPVDRNERSRPYTWAEIVLEFDVSAAGLPSDVRVVTRDTETLQLQGHYTRRLRETHFRPRLIDGEPVATTNVRSTHYVRRYISKREEEERAE